MKLPNADQAVVEHQKIVEYLLNETHPDNGGKARFFESLGYGRHNVDDFIHAIREAAASATVAREDQTIHGHKYVLDGPIHAPTRIAAEIRTIWIIDVGSTVPRLVTAYPKG